MRGFLHFFAGILAILLITSLHLAVSYLLPFPYSKLNIIMAFLVVLLVAWESGAVVWVAFFAHFLLELYSVTPFGIVLLAGTLSLVLLYWLHASVFTNRSLPATLLMGMLVIVFYRVLYLLGLGIGFLFGAVPGIKLSYLLTTFGLEMFFTTLATAILYILVWPLIERRMLRFDS